MFIIYRGNRNLSIRVNGRTFSILSKSCSDMGIISRNAIRFMKSTVYVFRLERL